MMSPEYLPSLPPRPDEFDFRVIIEWPAKRDGALPAWGICFYDAGTGELINTVTRFALVYADAEDLIWAKASMLVDPEGVPISPDAGSVTDEISEQAFNLHVTEMRIAGASMP